MNIFEKNKSNPKSLFASARDEEISIISSDPLRFLPNNITALLDLNNETYVELLKRSDFFSEITADTGKTAEELAGERPIKRLIAAEARFYADGDVKIVLTASKTLTERYYDSNVSLSEAEKEELRNELECFAKETSHYDILKLTNDEDTTVAIGDGVITGKQVLLGGSNIECNGNVANYYGSEEFDAICLSAYLNQQTPEERAVFLKAFSDAETVDVAFEVDEMGEVSRSLLFNKETEPVAFKTCNLNYEPSREVFLEDLEKLAAKSGTTVNEWMLQARGDNVPELDFKNDAHITSVQSDNGVVTAGLVIDNADDIIELMKRSGALRETAFSLDDAAKLLPNEVGHLGVSMKGDDITMRFYINHASFDWDGYDRNIGSGLDFPLTKSEQNALKNLIRDELGKDAKKKTTVERD